MKWIRKITTIILAVLLMSKLVPSEAVDASDDTTPSIYVQSQEGKPGEELGVEVLIKNNPGIAGVTLQVEYDPKLVLRSVDNGDALKTLTFTKPQTFSSPSKFLWDSESGMSKENGTLLTLHFLVSEETIDGETLPVKISYTEGDIFDENLKDVNLKLVDGSITVKKEWDCKVDGHKYDTVPKKIEGSDIVPAKNECLKQGSYKTAIFCKKCGEYDPETVQVVYTEAKGHNPQAAVKENEVLATHKTEGSYDLVVRCGDCNVVIDSAHYTTEKIAHTPSVPVKENITEATCKKEGSYDSVIRCSVCNEIISKTSEIIEKKAHTPAEAVKENEVAPTHNTPGSYELVVYCKVCKTELSRTKVDTEKEEHIPGEPVKQDVVEATCTKQGSYKLIVRCSVCNEILSTTEVIVDKIDHTLAAPVKENEIEATCESKGSYDSVVYCSVCKIEISRVNVEVEKKAHNIVVDNAVKPTYSKTGLTQGQHCSVCGMVIVEQQTIPMLKKEIQVKNISVKTTTSLKIAAGKKVQLVATVTPENATNKGVVWISSNTTVATVNANGLVSMNKKAGGKTVVIKAASQADGRVIGSVKLNCMKGYVSKVSISGKKTIKAGKTLKLKAKVSTKKGKANKSVVWSSSDPKVATVSNGKVKTFAEKKGTVKITVRSLDGTNKSKTVKIKIK